MIEVVYVMIPRHWLDDMWYPIKLPPWWKILIPKPDRMKFIGPILHSIAFLKPWRINRLIGKRERRIGLKNGKEEVI